MMFLDSGIPTGPSARTKRAKWVRTQVRNHNEANEKHGLKYLRSFLSCVVEDPRYVAAKDIYSLVNSSEPSQSVSVAKHLLSQSYESAEEHSVMVQIASFVKKYPFAGLNEDVRANNALHKFLRGERRNRHFNALLRARRRCQDTFWRADPYSGLPESSVVRGAVHNARKYIQRVIGDQPSWSSIFESCRWGPGACVGVSGQFTNFARKLLSEKWTVTPACIPYVLTAAKRFPMFWEVLGLARQCGQGSPIICVDSDVFEERFMARLVVVQHNKLSFVPKDADCDRTIASEPLLNQFIQLAIDQEFKDRLRKFNINLSEQRPNQVKAREGSLECSINPYTTADLKNASGSIYTELVKELLPPDWFAALNAIRSPSWMIDKQAPVKYEGFVSMGNGYCFPLETLIFASICSACHDYTGTKPDFRVYGDDIIVRQNESGVLQELLRYFGFELNPDKSFFFGPFRESCGADWYNGAPVRPVYFDGTLSSLEDRVRTHNALARSVIDARFLSACTKHWWPSFMPYLTRPPLMEDHADEALDNRWVNWKSNSTWNTKLQCPSWFGLTFSAYADRSIEQSSDYNVALMYGALNGCKSSRPFSMRRETRMSVASFSHAGGMSQDMPFESGRVKLVRRLPDSCKLDTFIGPRAAHLTTPLLGRVRPTE